MSLSEVLHVQRVPLSRSQQNIYNGVLRDADPQLYLIGRRYRFQPIRQTEFLTALRETIRVSPVHVCSGAASRRRRIPGPRTSIERR